MAAKKVKLKEPETKDTSSFASLMKQFGAKAEGVDSQSTPTPQSVDSQSTRVDLQSTPTPQSVDSQSTERGVGVDSQSTEKGVGVDSQSTRVDLQSTPIDPKTSPSAFWYAQNIDFYLIGFWNVLFDVIGTEGQIVTIRPLAKRFGIDKGLFHRQLKRLEAAGMLRIIPQKEGTFLQVLEGVLTVSQHEEEEVFKRQLPLPYNGNFQKMIAQREVLEAIFWGCLSVGRNAAELSGTTVEYLIEMSRRQSPEYVAGVLVKYIKDARHPLTFLQTIFQKEPDPLSQVEIDRGRGTLVAGTELIRNINRIDELGLNGMREFTKHFTALELGKTIDSARTALEALNEKRNAFFEKWSTV